MSIQDDQTDVRRRGKMARVLAKAGFDDVYVMDREAGKAVLTEKRLELLERLKDETFESVTDLADAVGRDKADVSRDLKLLTHHRMTTYDHDGNRKVPKLAHETIVVEPII